MHVSFVLTSQCGDLDLSVAHLLWPSTVTSMLLTSLLCLNTTISHCRNICLPCASIKWQHVFTCFHTSHVLAPPSGHMGSLMPAESQHHQVACLGMSACIPVVCQCHQMVAWACRFVFVLCLGPHLVNRHACLCSYYVPQFNLATWGHLTSSLPCLCIDMWWPE